MRFHELLTEAVYHNLANALKRALPDKSAEIECGEENDRGAI